MPLVVLAATILFTVSRIWAVAVRDMSTTMMSTITVPQLTGMAVRHYNIAAIVYWITMVARNTWMIKMDGWV